MTEAWTSRLRFTSGLKYQVIADALVAAIQSGELRAGDRLPPQRELAARLKVDLTTVTRAYDLVRQRKLIVANGRAGSFVAESKPVSARVLASVDSGMNMPPELPGNMIGRAIAETSASILLGENPAELQYQPAGGSELDRQTGAQLLTQSGLKSDQEQIVITAGGQNALHAILSANFAPGDALACGVHVYPGFKSLAKRLGLKLIALPEFSADAIKYAASRDGITGVYVVPTNDNPTARTLSLEERRNITEVVGEAGLKIVEDDAYGGLAEQPIPTLASLLPEQTWHIASTSKLISPVLRVAFVRAPSVSAAIRLADDVHETAIMAPPLNVAILRRWIQDGTYDQLIRTMRVETSRRQGFAREALEGASYASHPQGYHLWLQLPPGVSEQDLADQSRDSSLTVVPSSRFAVGEAQEQAVRVSLGGLLDIERLTRGLRLLAARASAQAGRSPALV
ncbi:PLP-dependent aminotransferase family protein [Aquisediminimonas profunda]|uniref:aminotransferase-like domain-containing protein n=1 Tax=Aquisediminimonas profunda TaxID=1550733 RepID=UPI001C625549|nr:PLP-dependent aminotransferase family protein [Aquisediminimonas profunda]